MASSVVFSPDGKMLACESADGTVRLWDVAIHRQIGSPLIGHTGAVNSVVFSPDGESLASGSADGTVRLWDVATHRQIGSPFTDHTGAAVDLVAFSPDGRTLADGTADGTVRLWDVAYLMDGAPQLCASAARSLNRAEWAQYLPRAQAYQVCH
jgi:WD40 repeat protein